ncbi:MAG TPA: transcription-repair coupling factor, partial [Verrucomicrobiae bacterium]|nr:transcription-repair coupling factor [Verrucomicrobiae bacterium]
MAQSLEVEAASDLFARFLASPAVHELARRLEQGSAVPCSGVTPSAQSFLAAIVRKLCPNRPLVAVTGNVKQQELLQQDLSTWLALLASETSNSPPAPPLYYPPWDVLPHEDRLPHADVISERLETLVTLSKQLQQPATPQGVSAPTVVTSVAALLQRTFALAALSSRTRGFKRGDRIEPLDLIEWLEDQGYEPEAQVTQKGEIALRGGIVDVFPLTSPWPVRLEFFGDELESLRYFDPTTQISRETIEEVIIPPGGELGILRKGAGALSGASVSTGELTNYLPANAIFLILEPEFVAERAREYAAQARPGDPLFIDWDALEEKALSRGSAWVKATEGAADVVDASVAWPGDGGESTSSSETEVRLALQNLDPFRPLTERSPEPHIAEAQRREFFNQLHRWLRQDYAVHVFCNNDGERQRFVEVWKDYGLGGASGESMIPSLHLGALSRGFYSEPARLVVITDAEIFGRYKIQRPRRLKSPHAQATRSALDIDFTDLEDGDYVVHLQHGIGRYLGLQVLPAGAGTKPLETAAPAGEVEGQECLVIEYAPNDPAQPAPKLYVPVTEAHLVSKYVGTGKARPPLNTLGGNRWTKAKAHAEAAVRDVAAELLALQAARDSRAGHAFPPDTPWQREFESAFIYEETPDQMSAIVATKADMERPKPMDRLICGDVGFGKTEVGIRAAFKAIMDGKQVAVLVPTTVLAQQHYNTFRERMADYPVRVELLSRFRTRGQQRQVVCDLAAGSVDLVIGTHRLLQNDIQFKDLGLVVIDEEQRFGVLHKEKFKMLRKLVDVLTLSATPIPRTLYLALTGARDMSTIQTPPHDRLPVETIVVQYDERVIRDAIQREINRGGQVFFLHNRVTTIGTMAQKLQTLVPNARIVAGHGQMDSDELEEVMTKFINGEADILLSTTIIESGLDIPNANTIIIDRADRFGLSDLYQLRGRVGRYKHQAYAYLLLPRHGTLVADVRKRISAIKQYSTLGSGFKIAMRDLEIRGAGNLLGAEQSGHITAVGFELYCQLLKLSVASLKGEKIKPRIETELRLDFLSLNPAQESAGGAGASVSNTAAFIPFKYIADSRQRIEIYRKIAQMTDRTSLHDLEKELKDRFGPVPPSLRLLLNAAELKSIAAGKNISSIEVKEDR